ncbi:hypothetical protein BDV96DRAFT_184131 [Lophiotrema nucula]|uniref:Nephrocystin 3-like N-terminal domain-containing protein n=1 Tax=Lophiotrema nucula TaxID=690887 RepID=A0A6A5YWJ3_9PLEO|nr:hypothetical protein BDV96DRAFT_184131 [Lophiotrema nucula]
MPINELANESVATAKEILKAINEVKLKGSHGNWKSFLHALQQVWKGRRIEKLAEKLSRLQTQLNTHLMVMMSDKHSEVVDELRRLYDIHKRLETNMPNDLASLRRDVLAAIQRSNKIYTVAIKASRDTSGKVQPMKPISRSDIQHLSAGICELSEKLSNLQRNAQLAAKTYKVLKSLQYKTMKVREINITEAHTATFEWIFAPNADTLESSMNFAEWLEHGSEPFWVMGKAGSGKSTLLKFLANHPRTNQMLAAWAEEKKLVTAKYFFWNAGNDLQKSKEGLLRSLLFEVLRQCPALIHPVCSWMPFYFALGDHADSSWSLEMLLQCFSRLSKQTETSTKFCFFIDGLDEYDGDCFDLIEAIKKLSGCRAIKVCVSSRPWFAFRDAFGKSPQRMIKLEDLTRNDIALYVRHKIERHERYNILHMKDGQSQELVQQIVDKADGVFLWVFLVTKSILHGLTNADRISDLQRRISLLPDTLEKYFRHILDTVEEVYRGQTAKALRYALHAPPTGPIPLIVFSYLDEENPNFALKILQRTVSSADVSLR